MISLQESGSQSAERRVHVVQGEYYVTSDPAVMLTTILGSCVTACLRDPFAGIGGMNHFLLPEGVGTRSEPDSVQFGVHAMELLVNGLLGQGARKDRLQAKLFGGGRLITGLADVGRKNADFAEHFLRREGIEYLGGSLRGEHARRIQFWPASGRVRQLMLRKENEKIFEIERRAPPKTAVTEGDIELF